jgi:hypothetical protein
LVPRALLQPRSVCVNFVDGRGLAAQAMALDHRTMLGPRLRIQSAETLLTYLGAVPEQLADFDSSHRRWGQGMSRSHFSRAARTCSESTINALT